VAEAGGEIPNQLRREPGMFLGTFSREKLAAT
jgi:hypothetical protein